MLSYRRKNKRPNIFRSKKKIPNITLVAKSNSQNEAQKPRIAGVLSEFCMNSSIHCISYFVDRKRHWIERVWWIISFVLLVFLCMNSIFSVWRKWQENPVIISLTHKPVSIGDIPFPAATICPETKTSAKKFNYTDVYRSMFNLDGDKSRKTTKEELDLMKIVNQICDEGRQSHVFDFFPDKYSDPNILSIISSLAPKLEETMVLCKLYDKWTPCDQFLFPTITEEGLCYTFNGLSLEELATNEIAQDFLNIKSVTRNQTQANWNLEFGYSNKPKDVASYPIRMFGTGKQSSFTILLRVAKEDIDHVCGGAIQGFKITFHAPDEGPQIWKKFFHISPGRTVLFTLSPMLVITSPDIQKYSLDWRQCFFNSERSLRFYKQYTQRNCEMECMSNFTLAECGCVEFSMPRAKDVKICGPSKIDCTTTADNTIFQTDAYDKCNCLPACESINYDVDSSQADYDLVNYYSKSGFQPEFSYKNSKFSRVVMSFKEELFTPSRRTEYYTLTNFLANSGGLAGLFLGASLLSFIELIYYFTLRIFFTRRKQNKIKHATSKLQKEHVKRRVTIASHYPNKFST